MAKKMLRFGAGLGVVAGLVLVLAILTSQPHLYGERNVAFTRPGVLVIDHGDPAISDEHIAFMDRGRYPFQDMAGGRGCDEGLVNVVHR